MKEFIQRRDKEGVAYLTLCRPTAYNSLSMALMQQLFETLDEIETDLSIRTVVIKGDGKGFCAGHDLKEMLDAGEESFYQLTFETCSKVMQKITSLPIPVIAQVHGVATAAGCQLVASCDLAYAADNARFGTPGVNIGLFCSTPMVALSRAVMPKHSMEMLLTGKLISAARAESMGLINAVVPEDSLEQEVEAVASLVASKSRHTLAVGKRAFHQQKDQSLADAYTHCSQIMVSNMLSEDAQEGIDAFIAKRQPVWKHC